MIKYPSPQVRRRKPKIMGYETFVEDTLMVKLRKMKERKEQPIKISEMPIYTDKRDGVIPGYNIRFDRFDAGLEACDKYGYFKAQQIARGENAPNGEYTGEQLAELQDVNTTGGQL